MATTKNSGQKPAQNPAKPGTTPPPTGPGGATVNTAPGDATAATAPKLSKRVTFWSQVEPSFSVRVMRALADKYPAPDHGGKPMVRRTGRPAGGGGKQAKEEREKLLAGMTEEQKLAFLAKEREEKKAKKTARKEAERAALKEQLRKELEAELGKK